MSVGNYLAVGLSYNDTDFGDQDTLIQYCTPVGDDWNVYQGYGMGNNGTNECSKIGKVHNSFYQNSRTDHE